MSSFRILNNFPVYRGADDLPLVGGELRFYESGTTTPKSVYGDPELTIDNGPVIAIGSDGRPVVDIWGDGSYRVRLYDADGTLVPGCEVDDVEIPGGDAATIPTLVDGYFLTNNGALLLWAEIRQLPDPTGQDGKMVVADGDGYILQPVPEIPEPAAPDIVVDPDFFQAGLSDDNTKFFVLRGTGTAPATFALTSSVEIPFDPGFDSLWAVFITPMTSGCTSNVPPALPSWSVTGFTAGAASSSVTGNFYAPPVQTVSPEDTISSAINFAWIAFGTREVAPPEEP